VQPLLQNAAGIKRSAHGLGLPLQVAPTKNPANLLILLKNSLSDNFVQEECDGDQRH
jgi:hypothetical protein